MSETELLPCPFCGAQAFGTYVAHVTIPTEHSLNHYQVACSNQSHCGAVVTGGRLKTEADAVKHWNKAHQADTIPRASAATKPFTPDWSLPDATAESLREHMAIAKAAQESERAFREQVAAAFAELRADFTKARDLHSAAAADKDYEGDAETGMRLSAAAVSWQDAVNRLDATIAALGLGDDTESCR